MLQHHWNSPPPPLVRKKKHDEHKDHGHGHDHNHRHPQTTPPYTFEFLLDLLKKVLQFQPDQNGSINGQFTCPEASYCNQKINECRKKSGTKPVDEHAHNPEFTSQERDYVVEKMVSEIEKDTDPLPIVSQKPNEIIYGNANDPDGQIRYTFNDGKWHITSGRNVNAIIIYPKGPVIEITPGPHIHQYGDGGNLMVAGACKGHHEEHDHHAKHSHGSGHHHDEHEHHHHKGPCSEAGGHGATPYENPHHKPGHSCSHHCHH